MRKKLPPTTVKELISNPKTSAQIVGVYKARLI
jgi:hypothetical protein